MDRRPGSSPLASLLARIRSLWSGLTRRSDVESDMVEEFRHHIDMRTRDLIDAGMPPNEARRQAHLEFGHLERHREAGRRSLGLPALDQIRFSWLDFKLGLRMLVRYPGLTIMAVAAMAIAITYGAGFFQFTSQWANPPIAFDPDHRLVGVTVREAATGRLESKVLHDFEEWRDGLRTLDGLGAFRLVSRNLAEGQATGAPVEVTEISTWAFRLTRTPALLGRTLVEDDERAGAPPVVVLGYDLWQERFAGDVDVVGRLVRIGSVPTTVVGVMPEGYEFPRSQNLWVPLGLSALDYPVGGGPGIYVFGQLAPDATLEQARAEIATRELRLAQSGTDLAGGLVVDVIPYPELVYQPVPGFFDPAFVFINLFILALAILFCANVALLLFARAAARENELLVRSSLGAGRYRIVVQLFSEALFLGLVAAVLGLFAAQYGYDWFLTVLEPANGKQPFWYSANITRGTALYVVALTALGAGLAGILPALKVTRGLAEGLRSASAGGGGVQFGGVWTFIIVVQVAVTVPLPALGYLAASELTELDDASAELTGDEYLTARLEVERALESATLNQRLGDVAQPEVDTAFQARYAAMLDEIERRLLQSSQVSAVAFVDIPPLSRHPYHEVELDEGAVELADAAGHRVGRVEVEPGYFEALQAPILAGRGFDSEDVVSGARVVIVDEPFVDRVLGGRNPVGRLLRYTAIERSLPPGPDSPWYEVVGVVGNLGVVSGYGLGGIYHPADRADLYPASVMIHVRDDASLFGPRLRAIAADVDPTLRVEHVATMDDIVEVDMGALVWVTTMIAIGTLTALMLSLAGLYAVMSFTVSRRTREIGIRVALGASRSRLVVGTFRRPIIQVLAGVILGALMLHGAFNLLFERGPTPTEYTLLGTHVIAMLLVSLASCVVPTRRALRIEPREALNVEG